MLLSEQEIIKSKKKNNHPNSVANTIFLHKTFSKECACEPSKTARASFAQITATATKPAQYYINNKAFKNEVKQTVHLVVKVYV
jgi:hypothetical protein